jgi:hypothetical protein
VEAVTPAQAQDQVIAAWARSGSAAKQLAGLLARELRLLPPGSPVTSSMKIAERHGTSQSIAVSARRFLTSAKIIHQRADKHYYTGPPTMR